MHSDYRHPKHDEMARRIREGLTDLATARELHVDRRAVARVRGLLGVPPMTSTTSLADKLDKFSTEPDEDGHVLWTGRTSKAGSALIRHLGREIPAAHVAFERRVGSKPVGTCRADCDMPHCVAPAHVMDDVERRALRGLLRTLEGLPAEPWVRCPAGHAWWAYGRFEADLTPYCKRCNTERAQRSRAAREAERNS